MQAQTFDPAAILGCTPDQARLLLRGRRITPGEVEAAARSHYHWRQHLNDDKSYWMVTSQVARRLSLSTRQVHALLDRRQLPYLTTRQGVRLVRRSDVEQYLQRH
jgi:excisionase family DNA binding protein